MGSVLLFAGVPAARLSCGAAALRIACAIDARICHALRMRMKAD
jgi:hypothetical protein